MRRTPAVNQLTVTISAGSRDPILHCGELGASEEESDCFDGGGQFLRVLLWNAELLLSFKTLTLKRQVVVFHLVNRTVGLQNVPLCSFVDQLTGKDLYGLQKLLNVSTLLL